MPPSNLKAVPTAEPKVDGPSTEATRQELSRARVLARAWAETLPDARRIALAGVFAWRALAAFARTTQPNFPLNQPLALPFGHLDKAAELLAETLGKEAARLPTIEALNFITSLYPALQPQLVRGKLGAFYTPPVLVGRLLDQAAEQGLEWKTARVIDPAAGGSAFLLQAAGRMVAAMKGCQPAFVLRQLADRLLGLELDPTAASLAQGALEVLLADKICKAKVALPQLVRICDSLEEPPEERFDLVVGNPPYGRIALTQEQRRRYARSLYGHANLYGVFTDIALRWARPNGLVAYLTPTSFLAGQYYSALRKLLAEEAPPVAFDFVHARRGVFEDVLQETMLTVYRKGAVAGRAQVHYLHVANEREARITRNGKVGLPKQTTAPWLAPRSPEHSHLISTVEAMATRLSHWGYSVSTGPLVWNRFKSQLRQVPGGRSTYPLIWAEAVTPSGGFVFRAQKRNHAPFFKLEPKDQWLLVKDPCVLVQRTTAKEQQRRLVTAELPASFIAEHGGVVVENHLNMIRAEGMPKVPTALLAALLSSEAVDQVFRCMNGSVAVSAFELESLPLPEPRALGKLANLLDRQAAKEAIENECWRLYGGEHR